MQLQLPARQALNALMKVDDTVAVGMYGTSAPARWSHTSTGAGGLTNDATLASG